MKARTGGCAALVVCWVLVACGDDYEGGGRQNTLPGVEGEMGIFPMHVPLMTQIVPGEVSVRKNGQDYFLAVGEGFVEITGTRSAMGHKCLDNLEAFFRGERPTDLLT